MPMVPEATAAGGGPGPSGGAGLSASVKPLVGQRTEGLPGLPFREALAPAGGAVSVAVLSGPGAQDAEEDTVADGGAQGVQGHGAAVVDGAAEDLGAAARVAGRELPQGVARGSGVQVVEALLGAGAAVLLFVEPLGVTGESLVEPDVLPGGEGNGVAEPLVGVLMDEGAQAGGPAVGGA